LACLQNKIAGRLYKDVNGNGIFDSPPDIALANTIIQIVLAPVDPSSPPPPEPTQQTSTGYGISTSLPSGAAMTTTGVLRRRQAPTPIACPSYAEVITGPSGEFEAGFGALPPNQTIWIVVAGKCEEPLVSFTSSTNGTVANSVSTFWPFIFSRSLNLTHSFA
jgi:hypothetical protein